MDVDKIVNTPGFLGWVMGHTPSAKRALTQYSWASLWLPLKAVDSILRGIGQVCFADNPITGFMILLGLFIANKAVGLGALVCSAVAIVTALVFNQPDGAITGGLTNFNAVLVGTVITALYPSICYQPMPAEVWAYLVVGAVFTVCLLAGFAAFLAPVKLPALTLPFNVVACTVFICLRGRGLVGEAPETVQLTAAEDEVVQWDQVFLGSLLSVGQVFALENVVCSCLILVGIVMYSPIFVLFAMAGALISCFTALAVSSAPYTSIYAGVWGYNGLLSAGCLSVFMVPSLRIFILALVSAIFTTFLQAALMAVLGMSQLPVFTLPFCISSLLYLAVASASNLNSARVEEPTFPERHLILHLKKSGSGSEACARTPSGFASLP